MRHHHHVPLWLKLAYTAFLAVMVPVYWQNYGPTNFLYFCDLALFLVLIAVWTEKSIFNSMAAVGILLPQFFWCIDYAAGLVGIKLSGMTAYMFNTENPFFLRSLSLFHGWLPFLILFLLKRLGYDRRGLWGWTAVGWGACLLAYFCFPPAGAELADPKIPRNINYVWGMDDAKPQTMLAQPWYLLAWMLALFLIVYLPTHLVLRKVCRAAR